MKNYYKLIIYNKDGTEYSNKNFTTDNINLTEYQVSMFVTGYLCKTYKIELVGRNIK